MKSNVLLSTLGLCVAIVLSSASNANAFSGMFGGCCPEPSCGCADACEPSCGYADACDACCGHANTCCSKKRCGLFDRLRARHACRKASRNACCEPSCGCADACGADCCEPSCGCADACGAACEPSCGCAAACEPSCGCADDCCQSAHHGCCKKQRCGLLARLRARHACRSVCCEPSCGCADVCGADCCEPSCGCAG